MIATVSEMLAQVEAGRAACRAGSDRGDCCPPELTATTGATTERHDVPDDSQSASCEDIECAAARGPPVDWDGVDALSVGEMNDG